MAERWRWLDLDRQGPYENAATMPVLVRSVATTGAPTAQTSVWGATHINVGWFDDVDSTLDLALCDELDVAVIRRQFYGGGTVYYERECSMMWGFLLPKGYASSLDDELRRFQLVLADTLERVGLGDVKFEGSSDLRWHGRKLGALTAEDVVGCDSVGGFLNLRRPDLSTYLKVVRVPDDKFKDKVVKDMSEYVCTAEEVVGEPVRYEAVRDALVAAMSDHGVEAEASTLNAGEQKGVGKASTRVGDPAMIRRISSDRFRAEAPDGSRVGLANFKGRKLVRAGVAIDGAGRLAAAMMAGDLHVSPPDTLDRVAASLVGAAAGDADDLRARIAGVFDQAEVGQATEVMGVTTDDLLAAVRNAIAVAESQNEAGPMTLARIKGANVLVTGASSGIGAALAPMLASRGATVGIVACRTDRLAETLGACRAHGDGHRMWTVDLSDPAAAEQVALEAWDAFGHLDAVVNNAGRPMRRPVQALTMTEVDDVMRTNFTSPAALTLAVLPRMLERDSGVIVNVSSLGGRVGIGHEAAYNASKFALAGWSEAMAMDLWATGVDVRLIIPGAIDTEIWDRPGNDPAPYDGPFEPPETVATAICESLVADRFETYVPDLKAVVEFKTSDIDMFLAGAVAFIESKEPPV